MKVYYLNRERFSKGDIKIAFEFAKKLILENPNLKILTFLVYQQRQYEAFLSEMGFTKQHYKNHGFVAQNGVRIQIHTIKTYNPDYQFVGSPQHEVLIAVGVPPKELEKYEDKSDIYACIVIPWLLDENVSFLNLHEAINIETNELITTNYNIDQRVVNAINWLKATSYPNEGYHHPNDEKRLHEMANALAHYNVPLDYDSVVYCGMHNGLLPSASRQTANAFVKAQQRKFPVKGEQNYPFYKRMMETKEH